MLTYFHSMSLKKDDTAKWYLVLPIDIENPYQGHVDIYIYKS